MNYSLFKFAVEMTNHKEVTFKRLRSIASTHTKVLTPSSPEMPWCTTPLLLDPVVFLYGQITLSIFWQSHLWDTLPRSGEVNVPKNKNEINSKNDQFEQRKRQSRHTMYPHYRNAMGTGRAKTRRYCFLFCPSRDGFRLSVIASDTLLLFPTASLLKVS